MADDYQLFRFSKSNWSSSGEFDLVITKGEYSNCATVVTLSVAQLHQLAKQIMDKLPHDASCDENGCDL